MQIVEFNQDNVVVAEARGRIDTATSREFSERVGTLMVNGANMLLLDMSSITYISSVGFRALLEIGKKSKACDCKFGLCGLNDEIYRLFEISGFVSLFEIYPNWHDGIANLTPS